MLMDEKGFILIGVIVRRSAQALTVWLKGSGSLRYHATAMDAQRLALDFPGGRSVLQQSMMAVHHPLLARIRIGTDRRGLRVVFETESRIRYAIRPRPQALAIQFQPARKR
ncbi:MAG: hypothetical protein D6690_14845 [Nitrospirae bacterium]|nr:MAG: hypothetical protein D6690_14845 [Nitrospirota bacterium]